MTKSNHPNRGAGAHHHPNANITPQYVKRLRESAGLTQSEAADTVRGTLRAWQAYEDPGANGRRMHPGLVELFCIKRGEVLPFDVEQHELERTLLSAVRSYMPKLANLDERDDNLRILMHLAEIERAMCRRLGITVN